MAEYRFRPRLFHGTIDFIATFISVIIGYGNFWRFPYLAYIHGGGTFMVATSMLYFGIVKPIMLLEMVLGQFCRKGNITAFYKFGSAYTGVGVTQLCTNISVMSYYAVIGSVSLFYFSQSFYVSLPWIECEEFYGTKHTCVPSSNSSSVVSNNTQKYISEQHYSMRVVFEENWDVSRGISAPNWGLAVSLFVFWMFSYIETRMGVGGLGFFNYFFCLVPWVMSIMLIGKAMSLPGSMRGLRHLFSFDSGRFASPRLWLAASGQIIFSNGIGFGTTSMYTSYSNGRTNLKTASTIICIVDWFSTVLITIVVFATVGGIAEEINAEFSEALNTSQTAFAFIVYSYLVSKYYLAPVASILFFFIFTAIGISSHVSFIHMVTTQFYDVIPNFCSMNKINLVICIIGFVLGLPYLTPQGQLFLKIVDFFGVTMIICILAMVEVIVIVYLYGMRHFCWVVEFTVGERPDLISVFGWRAPAIIMLLDIYTFVMGVKEIRETERPINVLVLTAGWLLIYTSSLPIPLLAISSVLTNYKEGCPRMFQRAISRHRWHPGDPDDNASYNHFIAEREKEYRSRVYKLRLLKLFHEFIGY